ncbi:uncharacterized protein [Antedon mediterranea]|uniref:uncharacterized protein n=1 Tax=Antedon mediterranea TaxID=105859 RepID=UPI003AF7109C
MSNERDILRVFLCGAHSTGKTTLLEDVVKAMPVGLHYEEEIARRLIRELDLSIEERDPYTKPDVFEEFQRMVFKGQCEMERNNEDSNRDYIADRSIDPVVYTSVYLGVDAKNRLLELPYVKECIERYKNSIIFAVYPHEECIELDDIRLPPTLKELTVFTETLIDILSEFNISYTPITVLDRKERRDIVVNEIRRRRPDIWNN